VPLPWEQPKKQPQESAWEGAFRQNFSPEGLAALDPSPETVRALCEGERWAIWETGKKIDPNKSGANMPQNFGTVPERYGTRAYNALERAMVAVNNHADAIAKSDGATAAYDKAVWIFKLILGTNEQAAGFQPDGDIAKGGPKIAAHLRELSQRLEFPDRAQIEADLAEMEEFIKAYQLGCDIYWNEQMKPDMGEALKNAQISTTKLYHMSHDHEKLEDAATDYGRKLVEGNIKGRLNWLSQVMAQIQNPAPRNDNGGQKMRFGPG
jgi:hypothetical protein